MSEGIRDEGESKHQARVSDPGVEIGVDGTTSTDRDEWVATLVWRIAAELGCEPLALPPLGDQIDLDAVAALATDGHSSIGFTCGNCEVFVGYDGNLTVEALDEETEDGI